MSNNPRWKHRTFRQRMRARFKVMQLPCAICGREIDYSVPSDYGHNGFVIDEIIPISKAVQYGYDSPEAAAQDVNNMQPAHYRCNLMKSNKMPNDRRITVITLKNEKDGEW